MSAKSKILLIDDDANLLKVTSHQLEQFGYVVTTAAAGEEGLQAFKQENFDLVITDLQLPGISGLEVLQEIRRHNRDCAIIMITAYGTIENAVKACQLGADDYLTKPYRREQLHFVIEKALRFRQLQSENLRLRTELGKQYDFSSIIAKSARMQEVIQMAERVAASDATVLIAGESGTGKEVLAKAIHYNSPRRDKLLVTVNCPSIPGDLLESELFGHVKGAFTGAVKDREGKFELANGGTIFLDEIGDLKPELQAKLLRVLQEKEIERVGSSAPIKIDARVLAATNRDLQQAVRDGSFREDLYYRLMVVPLQLPPLREHPEDIPFLVMHFLKKHGTGKTWSVTAETLTRLQRYDWPGNVRELENTISRALILSSGEELRVDFLPQLQSETGTQDSTEAHAIVIPEQGMALDHIEKRAIELALQMEGGNQTRAAKFLRVPRHVLIYRMKKLGIGA